MAYRIDYGQAGSPPEEAKKASRSTWLLTMLVFCTFLVFVHFFWPQGRDMLWELLFPGGGTEARAAFGDFLSSLTQGNSAKQAFLDFCRDILNETAAA